jgi:hypothetical protein
MARVNEAKHARWRELLRQWRASGLSARAFCDRRRVPESQFWWWKRRLGEQVEAGRPKPAFVPVSIVGAARAPGAAIDIKLTNGHRLRVRAGCDRRLLADVLAALEGKPC